MYDIINKAFGISKIYKDLKRRTSSKLEKYRECLNNVTAENKNIFNRKWNSTAESTIVPEEFFISLEEYA